MRLIHNESEVVEAYNTARSESMSSFGDDTVYLEKFVEEPHHIEFQILGDNHGNVIHLFDRECSVQRRNQKVVEESPSPFLTPELRREMGEKAVAAAKARKADVLLCDTAGRLHNKKNLMEELRKIDRVIEREYADAYRENLLVLDATTGQNALSQLREFKDVMDITGIILTKMDGTAKGGIAIAIQTEFGVPVKYIGVGEHIEDLQKFNSEDYVNAIFDVPEGEDD